MTPQNWQLFGSQQTDLLLLPPLTGTWLGFRSGAITGAWYWILTKLRHKSLAELGLWALPMLTTWSCLGFLSVLVPSSISLAWSLTASSPSKTMCVVLFPVPLWELVFWGWWNAYLWTPLRYFVAPMHLFSQSVSIILRCGAQLLNVTFNFLSVRCIRWPGFVPITVSCDCVIDVVLLADNVVQGKFEF